MNLKSLFLTLSILLIHSVGFAQNVETDIKTIFQSADRIAETVDISETSIGTIVNISYENPALDIHKAEQMYYESIIRETRSTMSQIYYLLFLDHRNLDSVTITATDSVGNSFIRKKFTGSEANKLNWQALSRILVNAIPERWSTSLYSSKNQVWFDVPESVMLNRFYK